MRFGREKQANKPGCCRWLSMPLESQKLVDALAKTTNRRQSEGAYYNEVVEVSQQDVTLDTILLRRGHGSCMSL